MVVKNPKTKYADLSLKERAIRGAGREIPTSEDFKKIIVPVPFSDAIENHIMQSQAFYDSGGMRRIQFEKRAMPHSMVLWNKHDGAANRLHKTLAVHSEDSLEKKIGMREYVNWGLDFVLPKTLTILIAGALNKFKGPRDLLKRRYTVRKLAHATILETAVGGISSAFVPHGGTNVLGYDFHEIRDGGEIQRIIPRMDFMFVDRAGNRVLFRDPRAKVRVSGCKTAEEYIRRWGEYVGWTARLKIPFQGITPLGPHQFRLVNSSRFFGISSTELDALKKLPKGEQAEKLAGLMGVNPTPKETTHKAYVKTADVLRAAMHAYNGAYPPKEGDSPFRKADGRLNLPGNTKTVGNTHYTLIDLTHSNGRFETEVPILHKPEGELRPGKILSTGIAPESLLPEDRKRIEGEIGKTAGTIFQRAKRAVASKALRRTR